MTKTKLVIIGAGFAGITLMQKLARSDAFEITLISPNNHFEYYPGLYRIMSEHIPFEVFVPMRYLVPASVTFIKNSVVSFDDKNHTVTIADGTQLSYDKVVIATGTQVSDFGIPGVSSYAHFVTSLANMLQAKNELMEKLQMHIVSMSEQPFTLAIAGAGPTGVELAGELSEVLNRFARVYKYPREKLHLKIIQRDTTILPQLPEKVRVRATKRLQDLGVELVLGNAITAVHQDTIETDKTALTYNMFFWSAGSTQSALIKNHAAFELSPRKKVLVDESFQAKGMTDVYVLGDNAETQFSGLAQIAEQDGIYLAKLLLSQNKKETIKPYAPRNPIYVIPIGDYFGIMGISGKVFSGLLPWILRYAVDMRFFFFALKFKYFLSLSIERKLK